MDRSEIWYVCFMLDSYERSFVHFSKFGPIPPRRGSTPPQKKKVLEISTDRSENWYVCSVQD